jgi:hypothetical protein
MKNKSIIKYFFTTIGVIALLLLSKSYSYILFHNIVETLSIMVAFSVFVLVWNSRSFIENDYYIFIGISFLFVAIVDFIHTLAYFGMGVFTGYGRDLPTQLWIIARYIQTASFLVALVFINRKLNKPLVFTVFSLVTAGSISLAFFRMFPACFIDGQGLTVFKIASEYIICAIYTVSIYGLFKNRQYFDNEVFSLLVAAVTANILEELSFTLYIDVYGFFNMLGHFLKVASFFLVYKGIIGIGLKKPYAFMFRELKQREEALRKALNEVKTLRGIIPICAGCKKIRDDKGYWNQVESYVRDHSDAEFSHGICPECAKKLYPAFRKDIRNDRNG